MSTGQKLPLAEAEALASRIAQDLRPVVERLEVVGSIRRRRPLVGDIEILVEPRQIEVDLLGTPGPDTDAVRAVLRRWGHLEKSGDRYMQARIPLRRVGPVRAGGPTEVACDVFLCHPPAQWGSLLAIRTGPARLGHLAMIQLGTRGYSHRDGGVWRGREPVPVPDEVTFFDLAGLRYVPPHQRDTVRVDEMAVPTSPFGVPGR